MVAAAAVGACSRTTAQPATRPGNSVAPTTTTVPSGSGSAPNRCGVVVGKDVAVTAVEGSCAVTVPVGVSFAIVLDPGFNWQDPSSDSPSVTVSAITRSASGRLGAELTAAQAGRAAVSATGSVLCPPGQACPALARLWRLQVTVVP